jgi:hypothetical protein
LARRIFRAQPIHPEIAPGNLDHFTMDEGISNLPAGTVEVFPRSPS